MDDFKNNLPESDHAGFAPPQNDATPTSTPANDAAAASAANPFQHILYSPNVPVRFQLLLGESNGCGEDLQLFGR